MLAEEKEKQLQALAAGVEKENQGVEGTLPTLQKLMSVKIMLVPRLVTQARSVFFVFNNRSNFR